MTSTLKVTKIGNSTGIILPKDMLERLHVSKGDTLYAVETANGFEITPFNSDVAQQLEAAERVMREDRDVLRKLA
jgi:putative addiction module antidote